MRRFLKQVFGVFLLSTLISALVFAPAFAQLSPGFFSVQGRNGLIRGDFIILGNLAVGNGTPTVSQDGEDVYIEGTLEVDGNVRFDGTLNLAGTDLSATATELNEAFINVYVADICSSTASYAVLPHAGTVTAFATNVGGTIDSQTTVDLYLSAVDVSYNTKVTGGTITIAASSAAGTIDTNGTITGGNTVTANSGVKVLSDAACTGTIPATMTITLTR